MKKVALKPCPFKHGKKFGKKQNLYVATIGVEGGKKFMPHVCCLICSTRGPAAGNEYWAIKKWNDRAGWLPPLPPLPPRK
jgi:hypothetical protein